MTLWTESDLFIIEREIWNLNKKANDIYLCAFILATMSTTYVMCAFWFDLISPDFSLAVDVNNIISATSSNVWPLAFSLLLQPIQSGKKKKKKPMALLLMLWPYQLDLEIRSSPSAVVVWCSLHLIQSICVSLSRNFGLWTSAAKSNGKTANQPII